MDHAPGQRQFARMEKYREYYMGKYHLSPAEMDHFVSEQLANSARHSDQQRAAIVDICRSRELALASHDDATLEHVTESADYGMAIAEFPTPVEPPEPRPARGPKVPVAAPNNRPGGTQSGTTA